MKKYFILLFVIFIGSSTIFAQRNVVLIIADDIGTDYFGFYEDAGDTVDLPNIRALLAKGVRFKQAMSNPVCSSTRAGMLTGRYSFRTGVGNIVGSTAGSGTLDTAEKTLPRLLTAYNSNIYSANIGKWHLHNPNPAGNLLFPNLLGYAHFEGPFIGALPSYTNWTKYVNGVAIPVTNYATTENVNNAVSWLKPFRLIIHSFCGWHLMLHIHLFIYPH
ncbi:MAG: sulfatase-like hydrolase/transferase [Bacteroidetes bacterium]|nr:sulfatase-like hydrolase/transferase [Bacteroidota bacterium]